MSSHKKSSALIGHTGFVGSNLNRQLEFSHFFNSKNSAEMRGQSFEQVFCAGVPAQKWWANQNPEADLAQIQALIKNMEGIKAEEFTLISSIDVYPKPIGVDEDVVLAGLENHAYGKHRFMVEEFVRAHFKNSLIVRLPGLFGTGIKKNVIFDLMNNNCLEMIQPASAFQYYFLDKLSSDIAKARSLGISLINFSAEPLGTQEIMDQFFPGKEVGSKAGAVGNYNFLSKHAKHWSALPGYLYTKKQTLEFLGQFLGREK